MRMLILNIVCLIFCLPSFYGQNSIESRKSVYLELGGNGVLYSLNYDQIVSPISEKSLWGYRIGIGGTYPLSFRPDDDIIIESKGIPIEAYVLMGKKNHKLDFGLGLYPNIVVERMNESQLKVDYFLNFGYRYQPSSSGVVIRTGLAVQHFHLYGINATLPWIRFAIGYAF